MRLDLNAFPRLSQMDESFIIQLERFFQRLDPPGYIITSTFRTPEENKQVGGVSNSYHLTGRAADVVFTGVSFFDVVAAGAILPLKILYYPLKDYYHIQSSSFPIVFIGIAGEYSKYNYIDKNIFLILLLGGVGLWILFSK